MQDNDNSSSPPRRARVSAKSSNRADRTQNSNAINSRSSGGALSETSNNMELSTNPTSDKTISGSTLHVCDGPSSAHSGDAGLGHAASSARLGGLGGVTAHEDGMHVHSGGDGDTIVISSEESRHNEVEVRTNDKSMNTAESDESFIVQDCTDTTVESTTSVSPQSTATDKTGQTSASSSRLSSSQDQEEPQQPSSRSTSRRRGGSAGPRSRRSESRASSVCSEAGGGEEESVARTQPTKRRQRQKVCHGESDSSTCSCKGGAGTYY